MPASVASIAVSSSSSASAGRGRRPSGTLWRARIQLSGSGLPLSRAIAMASASPGKARAAPSDLCATTPHRQIAAQPRATRPVPATSAPRITGAAKPNQAPVATAASATPIPYHEKIAIRAPGASRFSSSACVSSFFCPGCPVVTASPLRHRAFSLHHRGRACRCSARPAPTCARTGSAAQRLCSPSISRASATLATRPPSRSMSLTDFSTSAALSGVLTPRAR